MRILGYTLFGIAVAFGVGCSTTPQQQPQDTRMEPLVHTVQFSGETLGIISSWYTGRVDNWRQILDANPGLEPTRMRIGIAVYIPRELLTREEPLPASYVTRFGMTTPKAQETQKAAQPVEEEMVESEEVVPAEEATEAPSEDALVEELLTEDDSLDAVIEPTPEATIAQKVAAPKPAAPTSVIEEEASQAAAAVEEAPSEPEEASQEDAQREQLLEELLQ